MLNAFWEDSYQTCLTHFDIQYRTIESLRLEKTSKIIKSNHQRNTTMPAEPCPELPYLPFFWTPSGTVTPLLPWAAWLPNFAILNSLVFIPEVRDATQETLLGFGINSIV